MNIWWVSLGIGIAGGIGTLCRFGMSELGERIWGKSFPLATLLINFIGSFLFGLVYAYGLRGNLSVEMKAVILTGFLGGFTTFSSFAFPNQQMLAQQQWTLFAANLLVQSVIGIIAVWLGIRLVDLAMPALLPLQQ